MWKDFEYGGLMYSANEYGQIKGLGRNKILKKRLNKDGYEVVTLGDINNRSAVKVHSIIARLFVDGYKIGLEVNHKDFNRSNNNASNLEWVTHIENVKSSAKEGRYGNGRHSGTNNGRAKISENDVKEIIRLRGFGESISSISRKFGIGWTQTKRIIDRESWSFVGV